MDTQQSLLQIGEVADRFGVSPRTVKYYEELGLVEPEERSAGGFRLYGEEGIHRLERILSLKSMGFSLSAIREFVSVREAAREASSEDVLKQTRQRLETRERELTRRIEKLQEDIVGVEALREEIHRDIALCKRRIREPRG